ncbi:MAG: alpha-ketoglutarate-dependent dioxygenase AlkB, partial [Pseudomonadota bacterium]|nr:alpha-ketoglutarate-dependent dioxygenase AlkB [Pseudomonadota bacterium]
EMHEKLLPLCQLVEKAIGFYPNNCLLNYYPDGESSMGLHSDATEELQAGTGVVIISLGAERVIAFRNKANKAVEHHYRMKSGGFLYMDQQVQYEWLHAIPKQQHAAARMSLTFRLINTG